METEVTVHPSSIRFYELPKLKREYKKAIKSKKESFRFFGAEIDINYAKYLIEAVENRYI